MRTNANKTLIDFVRKHLKRQLIGSGRTPESIEKASHLFDPDVLTLGFARRFATYKRPNLLLHNPQRLLSLLTNPDLKVQLVIAGKAHPADMEGQQLIQDWMNFIRKNVIHPPVIFLGDYDMHVSEKLVQGVDVWINTPRRPWEASGTSGMKVLVNGGINLSILDGWWAEAYTPQVGWALGDGIEHGDDAYWDDREADQLYNLLEKEVIPEFYLRNEKGIPVDWISRMRESMAQLTPRFSSDRSVREYTEKHYIPATKAYLDRTANKGELTKKLLDKSKILNQKWDLIQFGENNIETTNNKYNIKFEVILKDVDPDDVKVELYADGIDGQDPFIQTLSRGEKVEGSCNGFYFEASVPVNRPVTDFTARVIPCLPGIEVPLEISRILWQR